MAKSPWVRPMFDAIAPRYDLLNRLMSFGMDRGWRRHAVDQALDGRPSTILDAGAGTFDLSLEAWRRSADAPRIVALDFAAEMLAHGMIRARSAGAGVSALQGDALRLPLASGSVDAVVSAFLPRNLDSLPRAWSSFARVLRPGGVMVILEMTPVRTPVFRHLFRLYFHRWIPWVGRRISGHGAAYTWLPESVDDFPTAQELVHQIEAAGFVDVRFRKHALGTVAVHVARRP
ncbi:MAG: ubiquinone/menaquinone biosynthesis methyltransferase [Chloroflexi bacterium]|nr:ubiquinone/menaquinone biosynthesis methyltransferase [Chloroflexota bacterium]